MPHRPSLTALLSPDRDLDVVPADKQTEAPVPGSEEQDLHRGPAAVVHGHGAASAQHHQQPHEPCHAVPKGLFVHVLVWCLNEQLWQLIMIGSVSGVRLRFSVTGLRQSYESEMQCESEDRFGVTAWHGTGIV